MPIGDSRIGDVRIGDSGQPTIPVSNATFIHNGIEYIFSEYAIPSVEDWEETIAFDPTMRSPYAAGYVQTWSKFPKITDKWHIFYSTLTKEDKTILKNFERLVKVGSDIFQWKNIDTGTWHIVRFLPGGIKFRIKPRASLYYQAEFDIEEV